MGKRLLASLGGLMLLVAGTLHAKTVRLVYTDAQGTVIAKTDLQGTIIARYDYRPYGAPVPGGLPQGPGYTGHVNDPEAGLVYMQARYYDPVVGRFISVDPVAPLSGHGNHFNRYAYGSANPITNWDPEGKDSLPVLFQAKWFSSVVNRSYQESVVKPLEPLANTTDKAVQATMAVGRAIDSSMDVKVSMAAASPSGVGLSMEANVAHPEQTNVGLIFGHGASISADVSPKQPIPITMGNGKPGDYQVVVGFEAGEVVHAGSSLV